MMTWLEVVNKELKELGISKADALGIMRYTWKSAVRTLCRVVVFLKVQ